MTDMPETPPEGMTDEQATNWRQARAAMKATQDRAEAAEAKLAEMGAQIRSRDVEAALESAGYPSRLAKHYPADADLTPDALTSWVQSEFGLPSREVIQSWGRYDQLQTGATGNQPAVDPLDSLLARAEKGVRKAMDLRGGQPQPADLSDHAEIMDQVRPLMYSLERDVSEGRADSPLASSGRGGPLDPPKYAVRTESGR